MGIDAQMFVRTKEPVNEAQVKAWAWEASEAFGHDMFFIMREEEKYSEVRHALSIVKEYLQDGDTIYPEKGETFIEAHLWTRYYGEGYERGDLPFLVSLAEWLEQKIPGATVYYGGDSSGVCAEPFDKKARAKLFKHFVSVGHRPYTGARMILSDRHAIACDFCEQPMTNSGGGQGDGFWSCDGCGLKSVTLKDGSRHDLTKGEDFFKGIERVRAEAAAK